MFADRLQLGDYFTIIIHPHNVAPNAGVYHCVVVNISDRNRPILCIKGAGAGHHFDVEFVESRNPTLLGKARPVWWWNYLPRAIRRDIFPFRPVKPG